MKWDQTHLDIEKDVLRLIMQLALNGPENVISMINDMVANWYAKGYDHLEDVTASSSDIIEEIRPEDEARFAQHLESTF